MNPHRDLASFLFPPLIEPVSGDNAPASIYEQLEGRQLRQGFGSGVYRPIADGRVCGPMRNQPPLHEPAFVNALLTDDDGNVGGSLGSNVKARRVMRHVAVKIPVKPYVIKLERSCEATTHFEGTVALCW